VSKFIENVFGGRSPEQLATAVTRTFLQGFLGFLIGIPLILGEGVEMYQAALGGGITAVVALLHGLVQDPEARSARKALSASQSLDVEATVRIEEDPTSTPPST